MAQAQSEENRVELAPTTSVSELGKKHNSHQIMCIDNCEHSFRDLANLVLPEHMRRLRLALNNPVPMRTFTKRGQGPASIAHQLGTAGDFGGCYVMLEDTLPKYVGISRKVLDRLRQHVCGRTHFDASLAYAIAQRRRPTPGFRNAAMAVPEFQAAFASAQDYLRSLNVAFVRIDNALELYLFEAYAAIELRTSEWNTFRTH